MAARRVGPGVVKVRHPRPVACRAVALLRADDALWAQLFEGADVVSEGAAEREGEVLIYRGTTSIILSGRVLSMSDQQLALLARAATVDPHVKLRAVRIARREAQVRAPGSLHPTVMDVVVRLCASGVRLDIEVDAQVDASVAENHRG